MMSEEPAAPSFCAFHFADARIRTITGTQGALQVLIVDWRGAIHRFDFLDVVGYEVIGAAGEDLSHGSIIVDDPFKLRLQQSLDDSVRTLHCFALWSAWNNSVVLRVLAATVAINPVEASARNEDCDDRLA